MFNSIGRSSNFAQAGKAAADDLVRSFAAARRNSPDYGKIAQSAASIRSQEKQAAMKALLLLLRQVFKLLVKLRLTKLNLMLNKGSKSKA